MSGTVFLALFRYKIRSCEKLLKSTQYLPGKHKLWYDLGRGLHD